MEITLFSLSLTLQNAKDDDFTMEELLPSFARKQHDRIWTGLGQMCTSLLLNSPFENDEEVAGNKVSRISTYLISYFVYLLHFRFGHIEGAALSLFC